MSAALSVASPVSSRSVTLSRPKALSVAAMLFAM
jgi:hypothetical protein